MRHYRKKTATDPHTHTPHTHKRDLSGAVELICVAVLVCSVLPPQSITGGLRCIRKVTSHCWLCWCSAGPSYRSSLCYNTGRAGSTLQESKQEVGYRNVFPRDEAGFMRATPDKRQRGSSPPGCSHGLVPSCSAQPLKVPSSWHCCAGDQAATYGSLSQIKF